MIEVDDYAIEIVKAIQRLGIIVYLASNQDSCRGEYISKKQGFRELVDREYCSYAIGLAKPDEVYFKHILNDLSI